MSDQFLGEIRLVPYNFAPRGWAFCNGQLMAISQNTALFSLIGTFYGGDGNQTFALPDLRCRFAMHQGEGAGLSQRVIGEVAGEEQVTLTTAQMPTHNHTIEATDTLGSIASANGAVPARAPKDRRFGAAPDGNTPMNPGMVAMAGGSQAHDNMPPFLVMSYIIALTGIFPSRN
jgi:microcystin-dependent protein